MTNSVISPQAGVDFTKTYTISTSTPEYPGLPFVPGTIMQGTNGSAYIFVKAAENLVTGHVIYISSMTTWESLNVTNARARTVFGIMAGVVAGTDPVSSLTGIPSGSYGWMQIQGYVADAKINTSAAAFAQVYSDATSPYISTTAAPGTNAAINGIVLLSASAGNSAPVFLNFPTVGAAQ